MELNELSLGITAADWITMASGSYRPSTWPPPRDWVVCEDRNGNVLSKYGDPIWDMSTWADKSLKLNFGDGQYSKRSKPINPANADLLRQVMVWRLWGPRPIRTARTAKGIFSILRRIFSVCSEENILASELTRYPRVLDRVIKLIPAPAFETLVNELHRLLDAHDNLGFIIATKDDIKRISMVSPVHNTKQTPYIPPRIWAYQVSRLREFLDEFIAHSQQIEDCFNFCLDAYKHNYGTLTEAVTRQKYHNNPRCKPFAKTTTKKPGIRSGRKSYGSFEQTAERFGILELIRRWVEPHVSAGYTIVQFSSYLSLAQWVGQYYIINFSLQRREECGSLRTDCLVFENDDLLGRVPIICGETTKTQQDSDARWPTSPSVERAVQVMTIVARLRIKCAADILNINPSDNDLANPYLINRAYEPWVGYKPIDYRVRQETISYSALIATYPKLFDQEQLRITAEDIRIARMLTPDLSKDKFAVGLVWPLAAHQLRRTGAVNMFVSGLLSDSTMQYLMKHSSCLMPLYYGRGHTKLHLNEEVEKVVISTMYEAMSLQVLATMGDRFISPHGQKKKDEIVVHLIGGRDAKAIAKAARNGDVSSRENRLGICTSRTICSYGGVESIARCSGGDGFKPCIDVLYDREKTESIKLELKKIEQELARVTVGSPRHNALLTEKRGMENFLNVVQN